jgi:hypothetical protein
MKIPIPRFYDRAMDWIAVHFLPPDKPTGLRIYGYNVTWLDVSLVVYPTLGATGLYLWDGNWWWFPLTALSMAFVWIWWGYR